MRKISMETDKTSNVKWLVISNYKLWIWEIMRKSEVKRFQMNFLTLEKLKAFFSEYIKLSYKIERFRECLASRPEVVLRWIQTNQII